MSKPEKPIIDTRNLPEAPVTGSVPLPDGMVAKPGLSEALIDELSLAYKDAAIASWRVQVELADELLAKQREEIEAQAAEIARLREALKPFAAEGECQDGSSLSPATSSPGRESRA